MKAIRKKQHTLAERFWVKVMPPDTNGCMNWAGTKDRAGYGRFWDGTKKTLATHVALALAGRPIPVGLWALHTCDNPSCVNQAHLFHGTVKDNAADRERKGRGVYVTGERHGSRTHPECVARGERIFHAKLTCEKVLEIRRIKAETGMLNSSLATMFGVQKPVISKILNRKLWTHV